MGRFHMTTLMVRILCCLLAGLFVAGCRPGPPGSLSGSSRQAARPAWDEQVAAVRTGQATRIQYENGPLSSEDLRMLAEGCQSLRFLDVPLGPGQGRLLGEMLRSLPQLERLKVTGPVDDELLGTIAAIPTLQILNLPQGEFSDRGLEGLVGHQRLELLRFHSQQVSNDGLRFIAQLPKLRFLHLIDVPINDAGLEHLTGLTRLESFYLDGSDCTEEGLSRLIRTLPQLHFHWNDLHLPDDPHRHPHPGTSSSGAKAG